MSSSSLTDALLAIAPNNSSSRAPSVAKAHAVFAKFCGLNSSSLTSAIAAIGPTNASSHTPSVTKAHALFSHSC